MNPIPNKVRNLGPGLDPSKVVECPLCLEMIVPPVTQCEVGHSMCKSCFQQSTLKHCPICRGPITNRRHVAFEQLLESFRGNMALNCRYSYKGCKYNIGNGVKEVHERDCRYRTFQCEGKVFAGWGCDWNGEYSAIENHFKTAHRNNSLMQYKVEAATQKINFHSDFKDLQLISFFNGQAYFYYKHFVDTKKKKLFWTFQYVGLQANAEHFFYEFEIFNGPIRKFKVSEICHNDTAKSEDIFENEKCVAISFATAKNFLNDQGELSFKYRIIKLKTHPK